MTTLPPVVLYAGHPDQRAEYAEHLSAAFAAEHLDVRLIMDPAEIAPPEVTHLVFAGHGPLTDLTPYTGLRAILNLWAGVETILPRPDLPKDVPLCRMVETGLTLGMVDYVTGHVLRYHLAIDRYIGSAPITEWERNFPPLAGDRTVGILGLGTLGQACAGALKGLGFRVSGWSRSQKSLPGLRCHHGPSGLDALLSEAEILVGLLPQTPETTGLLNAETLARLPQGACLINAGRGALIDDAALLKALDNAHLGHATLDVFDTEPLPTEHPFWVHPKVTVTPHIASVTRPKSASKAIAANIVRDLAGKALVGVVDRDRGY